MKICILGDTHFGVRADSIEFHNFFKKFYSEFFFPELESRNIDTIIQLGDLFDRRKYIQFNTLALCREYFFNQLSKNDLTMYTLIGNHDIPYRNTLSVNAQSLLLNEYKNIHIIQKFETKMFDGLLIDFIPWICEDNQKDILSNIKQSQSSVCVGHLEINGCSMGHSICEHGLDGNYFNKYDIVLSGHFHTKSTKNNIIYTGTPYEMNWTDYCIEKGIYILDTETLEIEFIKNPFSIFSRIDYDDNITTFEEMNNHDYSQYKDLYVKVVVINKNNPYQFDIFLENIHKSGALDVKVVEDFTEDLNQTVETFSDAEDTLTIINKVIDSSTETNKNIESNTIKRLFKELYIESINPQED